MTSGVLGEIMRVYGSSIDELVNAASKIMGGGLIAFPTETVYGLGALGINEASVIKVFRVKGRPSDTPLILHISSEEMLEEVVTKVPDEVYNLIRRFWPGPLTLVLPKSLRVPKVVSGGRETVGVRWPSHPVAQELISYVGEPLAAPSANKFMGLPPLTASDVVEELNGLIDAVIDGGEVPLGVESTVIDVTARPFRALRPGSLPISELEDFLGEQVVRVYGGSVRRYRLGLHITYVRSCRIKELSSVADTVLKLVRNRGLERPLILSTDETVNEYLSRDLNSISLGSRGKPLEIGKNFIKALRSLKNSVSEVVVEPIPCTGLWEAIDYRFIKAASEVLNY